MKNLLFNFCFLIVTTVALAQVKDNRWHIDNKGGISWNINGDIPHTDHIEMSGKRLSAVISYGVNEDRSFFIKRDLVWPMLRTIPNNTHASLMYVFETDPVKGIKVDGKIVQEKVKRLSLNGTITVKSLLTEDISCIRVLFPSNELPVFCELYTLKNEGAHPVEIEIPDKSSKLLTDKKKGVNGVYTLSTIMKGAGMYQLMPGESIHFDLSIKGEELNENYIRINIQNELSNRQRLIDQFWNNLVLETPDQVLNKSFAFAKIRAAESIYQTMGGPMHGPGGLSYYAAIWANDQAEYINPFFPYLGYDYGIESAINSYEHFARFMNDDYKPLPSSIIAEGTDVWIHSSKDRGDAAMIAYGASRFGMTLGDKEEAKALWPLIEWCLEYSRRKINKHGVVDSPTDELEGRFPTGDANLNTSSLHYDALISASHLGRSLGLPKDKTDKYLQRAAELKDNMEIFFGATMKGFETYRYFEENKKLRAWICIPLTVDIFDRKEGTIDALFSPELWTKDGLATEAGDKTFWDRATLYGLRGVFAAGETKRGLDHLKDYSERRLLGEHVPYPVEAYPEGGQKHLSAESGLYCRIYTEGLFGIRPTGLKSFNLTPQLPEEWNQMKLKRVHGFGEIFDVEIYRVGDKMKTSILKEGFEIFSKTMLSGQTIHVKL